MVSCFLFAHFVKIVAISDKKVIIDCSERILSFRGAGGEPPNPF